MPLLDIPRLYRSRFGVHCYRLRSGARDQRVSLGTKNPLVAHMMAAKINEAVEAAKSLGDVIFSRWGYIAIADEHEAGL